jgi:hypothetical protein
MTKKHSNIDFFPFFGRQNSKQMLEIIGWSYSDERWETSSDVVGSPASSLKQLFLVINYLFCISNYFFTFSKQIINQRILQDYQPSEILLLGRAYLREQ